MKKLICLLASAALLGACEQQNEVAAPATPAPTSTDTTAAIVRRPTGPPGVDTSKSNSDVIPPATPAPSQ